MLGIPLLDKVARFLGCLVSCFFVSWFLGFLASYFFGFLVSMFLGFKTSKFKMFQCSHITKCPFQVFVIDIDLLSKFQDFIKRIVGIIGDRFSNSIFFEFLNSETYKHNIFQK